MTCHRADTDSLPGAQAARHRYPTAVHARPLGGIVSSQTVHFSAAVMQK
jgi:hypothetical protein